MTPDPAITEFLALQRLAIAGVSRKDPAFANGVFRHLRSLGREPVPVNPHEGSIEGVPFVPSLRSLGGKVDGAIISVPPAQVLGVLQDAQAAGIARVWIQQQSETPEAIRFCQEHGMRAIVKECVLMYSEGVSFPHRLHGFFRGLGGHKAQVIEPQHA